MAKSILDAQGPKRHAPSIGIGFAIAGAVWLVFDYRFPTKPLGEMEYLAVWMVALGDKGTGR